MGTPKQPSAIWQKAYDEFPGDSDRRRARYNLLMADAGYLRLTDDQRAALEFIVEGETP